MTPDIPRPINYTKLAKVLRKEAGDIVTRVLTRNEMQSVFPGCIGVGSPFIVNDPDTYQPQMLFTAWSDVSGLARQVWVADIDEDLSVKNMRKIADGSLFNVTGLNTCTAFWDDYNEQWVFACTAYGAPKISYGYFIFFDKNWNVKGTQVIDFAQTVDTQTWTPNLGDAGIGMVPHYDKGLILSAGYDTDRSLFYISNYTTRPLPSPTKGLPLSLVDTTVYRPLQCPLYHAANRDVHQLFVYNGQLIMLSEKRQHTGLWNFEVCFGPEKDWYAVPAGSTVGKYHLVSPIVWSHLTVNYTHVIPNYGHPHYTSLLGVPLLFFVTFPTWNAGGKRAYAHEIWAQKINPEEAFNPARNFPLIMSAYNEPYRVGKIPIPTFGANTLEIFMFGVSASGTLTITESTSPYHLWALTGMYYTSTYSISVGSNKLIIDKPAPYVALNTDVNLTEFMVILR
jgi:hypothetical protein